MAMSRERYMALKSLFVELRWEYLKLLQSFEEDWSEFRAARRGGQHALDRLLGMMSRLEQGQEVVCRKCGRPRDVGDIRSRPFARRCKPCQDFRDTLAATKRAVRMRKSRHLMFRNAG